MPETSKSSPAIQALIDQSVREGNHIDVAASAEDPAFSVMALPMSDDVRRTGEWDRALSYMQTVSREVPREGFIDEAAEVAISFPFTPEALAAAQSQLKPSMTWRTLFSVIAGMIGIAVVGRALIDRPFDSFNLAAGIVFLVVAVMVHSRRRRT